MSRSDRQGPRQQQPWHSQKMLPQLQQPQVVQQQPQMMYPSGHYLPGQTPSQGGSVDGSTHSRHKRRQHRHRSHKSSQHEGNSHKSHEYDGHRRERHRQNSHESSRREGSSCQSSESGAWSEEEGDVLSSRTSVCSSTAKVHKFLNGMRNQDGDMHRPPTPATIADDVGSDSGQSESSTGTVRPRTPDNYMHPNGDITYLQTPVSGADDDRSDSGRSRISAATVLGPGIQPLGVTRAGRPKYPPGASGYPRRVYRERSMGPPSVASFSTASTSQYGGDDERSESSYTLTSSRGYYGADDERSESEATLCEPDLTLHEPFYPKVQAEVAEFEEKLKTAHYDVVAMEKMLVDMNSDLVKIKNDLIKTGELDSSMPAWFNNIRFCFYQLQGHFARLEGFFPACRATSQQYAPGAISTPARAGLAMDKPYRVLSSY